MATKSDLIEAQNFSRRRLLTAFTSGAPEGKELEPAAPLRAVIAAIALTAAVVLAGVFYGLIQPGLPSGWQNGKLIIAKDTGARYVTVDGVLHPVLNTASARLLMPAGQFDVINTSQSNLADIPLGSTVGIVGAPDQVPAASALIDTGWTACLADAGGIAVQLGEAPAATATDRAIVVDAAGGRYVVAGGTSHLVDAASGDAVLRAAGIAASTPRAVSVDWLNLFTPGAPLAPLTVTDAGDQVLGTTLRVGDVIHYSGSAEDDRFLVQSDHTLAPLSPLAWQLYQLGSGAKATDVKDVPQSVSSGLPTAKEPSGGADWPAAGFTPLDAASRPCALLASDGQATRTVLAARAASLPAPAGVSVAAGHGALVNAAGRGDQSSGLDTLIDATGTAYALPGATEQTLQRLGYQATDVTTVTKAWIPFFLTGPALTEFGAGGGTEGQQLSPSPTATGAP